MNRFKISLFTLFVLFVYCFPLNAQEIVAEKSDSAEEQLAAETPQNSEATNRSISPTASPLRVMQFMMEAEQQGKMIVWRFGDDEYTQLIGITPAQELYLGKQMDTIREKVEQQFGDEEKLSQGEYFEFVSQLIDETNSLIRETLTPVQLQNAMEYELTVPSVFSHMLGVNGENKENNDIASFSFAAYEILDLSEEQKEKMQEIRAELNSEFEKFMKEQAEFFERFAGLSKEEAEQQNFMEQFEKLVQKGKSVVKKFQEKTEGTLTQEQKDRLATIREEIPKKLASIREELAKKAKENPVDESWKDSWKPGDPLPEGAVPPQRKPRFPFKF